MYRYKVTIIDEDEFSETTIQGIVQGNDYGDAVNKVIEYACAEVISITIYQISDILEDDDLKDFEP